MRTPSTTTLFVLAVLLLLLGSAAESGYYPAATPVVGPDGTPLVGTDGRTVVHRDMEKYYRLNAPAFAMMGSGLGFFDWGLVRVSRRCYAHVFKARKQS